MQKYIDFSAILFWNVANIGVLGYAIAFVFFPEQAKELFVVVPSKGIVRYIGCLFLLASGGINQTVLFVTKPGPFLELLMFSLSLVVYMLSAVNAILVFSSEDLFVENQTFAFYVLYSIFFTGLLFGFFGTFGSYTVKKLNLNVDPGIDPIVAQLKEVKVTSLPVKRIAASRKELINSAK